VWERVPEAALEAYVGTPAILVWGAEKTG
jgi:hypothetical protein